MVIQVEFLKTVAYFSGLSPAELDSVKRYVHEKAMARGEMVLAEGEPAQALYFVAAGVVKVFKTSADGKEQILSLVRPGESFNDVPVFGGANMASAVAMGDVAIYEIQKTDLAALLRSYPAVAVNALRVLSRRVEQLALLVEDLSFRHVTNRVAKILVEYAADGTGQRAHLTQQDMAAMAGTAREMVGRSLKTLEAEGKIRMERHRIIISNLAALREAAGIA